MDTRTLTVTVDDATLEAVRAALEAQAGTAQRAAMRAAVELDEEATKDKRPGALTIVKALTDAGRLAGFSERLLAAWVAADGPTPAGELADLAAATTAPPAPPPRDPAAIREELRRVNGDTPEPSEPEIVDAAVALEAPGILGDDTAGPIPEPGDTAAGS